MKTAAKSFARGPTPRQQRQQRRLHPDTALHSLTRPISGNVGKTGPQRTPSTPSTSTQHQHPPAPAHRLPCCKQYPHLVLIRISLLLPVAQNTAVSAAPAASCLSCCSGLPPCLQIYGSAGSAGSIVPLNASVIVQRHTASAGPHLPSTAATVRITLDGNIN